MVLGVFEAALTDIGAAAAKFATRRRVPRDHRTVGTDLMTDIDVLRPPPRRRPIATAVRTGGDGVQGSPQEVAQVLSTLGGAYDTLAPNEVICPVCKVVIRATRELRPGDKVYCMPCMSRMVVVVGEDGRLEAEVIF